MGLVLIYCRLFVGEIIFNFWMEKSIVREKQFGNKSNYLIWFRFEFVDVDYEFSVFIIKYLCFFWLVKSGWKMFFSLELSVQNNLEFIKELFNICEFYVIYK